MSIRTFLEPSRSIDIIHETDVLVVGSGPGGLAAALACARTCASTPVMASTRRTRWLVLSATTSRLSVSNAMPNGRFTHAADAGR